MNDARRQAYLHAMGVTQFVRRDLPRASDEEEVAAAGVLTAQEDNAAADSEVVSGSAHAVADTETDLPLSAEAAVDESVSPGLSGLRVQVENCQACELCRTRTRTVFGAGNPTADLMVVGEAPGADEDRLGEPFVGRAGQLLNAMLKAIGLDRDAVYIANILKCRPPANRNPSVGEVAACRQYLDRQIELVQPRVILSVGAVSAHNLLQTDEAVGRLRRQRQVYGKEKIPLRVTYHPAYLLRRPEEKAKSWEDLQQLASFLR